MHSIFSQQQKLTIKMFTFFTRSPTVNFGVEIVPVATATSVEKSAAQFPCRVEPPSLQLARAFSFIFRVGTDILGKICTQNYLLFYFNFFWGCFSQFQDHIVQFAV